MQHSKRSEKDLALHNISYTLKQCIAKIFLWKQYAWRFVVDAWNSHRFIKILRTKKSAKSANCIFILNWIQIICRTFASIFAINIQRIFGITARKSCVNVSERSEDVIITNAIAINISCVCAHSFYQNVMRRISEHH